MQGGQYARSAAKFAEAIASLEASSSPPRRRDCLVLAHLRSEHAAASLQRASAPEVEQAQEAALLRTVLASLPAVLSALEARRAAGTLLPAAAEEDAWYTAEQAHIHRCFNPSVSAAAAAAVKKENGRLLGYETFVRAANLALATVGYGAFAELAPLPAAQRAAHCAFVAAAAEMVAAPRALGLCAYEWLGSEAAFVYQLQSLEGIGALEGPPGDTALGGVRAAWRALQASGQLAVRKVDEGVASMPHTAQAQLDAAAAHAAARGGARGCAADGCAAREAYVSQFKLCGACKTVVYCSKEHQAAHWPAHKQACKAARKAAEQPGDSTQLGAGASGSS